MAPAVVIVVQEVEMKVEIPASETTAEWRYHDMFRRYMENMVREIEYELAAEHFRKSDPPKR